MTKSGELIGHNVCVMFDIEDLKKAIDEAKVKRQKICIFFEDPQNVNTMEVWENQPGYPDYDVAFYCTDYANLNRNDVLELAETFFTISAFSFPFALVIDFRKEDCISLGAVAPSKQSVLEYEEISDGPIEDFVCLAKGLIYAYAKNLKCLREY